MPVLPTPDLLDSAEAQPNNRCVHGLCRTGLTATRSPRLNPDLRLPLAETMGHARQASDLERTVDSQRHRSTPIAATPIATAAFTR